MRRLLESKFARDVAHLQVASGLSLLSQLGSTFTLAFLLGAEKQGLFLSAGALHALGHCLMSLGVPQVVASQISANAARGRSEKTSSWIAFLVKVNLLFALWLGTIGYFAFPWIAETLLGDGRLGTWAWWLCLGTLLEVPREMVRVAFQGTRRMGPLGLVENAHEMIRFFLVSMGALITGEAEGALVGGICASGLGSLLAVHIYQRERGVGHLLPGMRETLGRFWSIPIRKGLRQGVRIAAFKNLHTLLFLVLPKLAVQSLAGSRWVAYFHIAQRLTSLPQMLTSSIARTALPALGEKAGKRDAAGLRRIFASATLGNGLLVSGALGCGLLLIPWLLPLFFPPDYVEPVIGFAVVLAIGESAGAFTVCLEAFFISLNRLRVLLLFSLLGLATAVPGAAWLTAHVEVTGPAWGIALMRGFNLLQLGYAIVFLWGHRRRVGYWAGEPAPGASAENNPPEPAKIRSV